MKQNLYIIVLIVAAVILGIFFGIGYGPRFDLSNEKEAFDQGFRKSCLNGVGTKNNALDYCNCTLETLHKENSFSELKGIGREYQETNDPPEIVVDAFTRCAKIYPLS